MHPLEATLQQVRTLNPYFKISFTPTPPEATVADWCHVDAPLWQRRIAYQQRTLPAANATTHISAFVQAYCWPLLSGPIACYVLARRVPLLAPGMTHVRDENDLPAALELLEQRFFCLPDDPAAAHPDAMVVPTHAALTAALRAQIEQHITPIVTFLTSQSRLVAASCWLLVADACAGLVVRIYDLEERHSAASMCAAAQELCSDGTSPLTLPAVAVSSVALAGGDRAMYRRLSCCFWHKRPNGGVCVNCPRRSHAEQDAAVAEYFRMIAGRS